MPFQRLWEKTISGSGTVIPAGNRDYFYELTPASSTYLFDLYPPFKIGSATFSLADPYVGGRTEYSDQARISDDGSNKMYWRVGPYPVSRYTYYPPLASGVSAFTLTSGNTLYKVSVNVPTPMSNFVCDTTPSYPVYDSLHPDTTLSGSMVYLERLPSIVGSHGAYVSFTANATVTGTLLLGSITSSGTQPLATTNITAVNSTNFTSPANVIDGLTYTYWSGNTVSGVGNPKLQFDYVIKESPERVRLQKSPTGTYPYALKVNVGDALTGMTTVYSGTLSAPANAGDWSDWISINPSLSKYRYWELEFIPVNSSTEVYVSEVEFNCTRLGFNISSTYPFTSPSGVVQINLSNNYLPTSNGVVGLWCKNNFTNVGKSGVGPTDAYSWNSSTSISGSVTVSLGASKDVVHPKLSVIPLCHSILGHPIDFSQTNSVVLQNGPTSSGTMPIQLNPQGYANSYTISFEYSDPVRNANMDSLWKDEHTIRAIGFTSDVYVPNIDLYIVGSGLVATLEHLGNGFKWLQLPTPIRGLQNCEFELRFPSYPTNIGTTITYDLVPHYTLWTDTPGLVTASSIAPVADYNSRFSGYNVTSPVPSKRTPVYFVKQGGGPVDTSGKLHLTLHLVAPSGTTVSGGDVDCVGSHYSEVQWSFLMPVPTSSIDLASFLVPEADVTIQAKTIGDAIGINPNDVRYGLLAWHPLEESEGHYFDKSGNGKDAWAVGNMAQVLGRYGSGESLGDYPYGHIETNMGQQANDYMVSFWFKPTMLLTSGVDNSFVIMKADDFYGDHFKDRWDYKVYPTYKGWSILNQAVTCSAGHLNNYLRLKGNPYTDWQGATWTSSTAYFDIPKSQDWTVEIRMQASSPLQYGQAAGFIFFNKTNYLKYCSLVWRADTLVNSQLVDSVFPTISGKTNMPSPYVIDCSSYYANTDMYHAWHLFNPDSAANYYWYSGGNVPQWISIYMGPSPVKIVQGYRLKSSNYTGEFPKNWVFQGSLDGQSWKDLHTMVNQPRPANQTWTSWFYFSNAQKYKYYRVYVTSTQGAAYVSLGEIDLYVKDYASFGWDANIAVQTEDLSYTIEDHATTSGIWIFEMQKKDQYVWFNYKREDAPGWSSPIYRMDVSLWGDDMRLGVQSRNPYGDAPEILFDYFRFKEGRKPIGVGDPENPGRFLLTYNKVDVQDNVENRTDGRLWAMTGRDGFAYGTARWRWEPDKWYLLQFGIKPNANPGLTNDDYCWWVNGQQQKGLVVGSGTGSSVFIPNNTKLNYYDPEPYTTHSGSFIIDEVSHWSRWLTAEEIIKMINKVSQVSWHKTEPYPTFSEYLVAYDPTQSGSTSVRQVPNYKRFEWYTQYQSPHPDPKTIQFEKISYRMQKDIRVYSYTVNPVTVNIYRNSSGWLSNNLSCYPASTLGPENPSSVSANYASGYSTPGPSALLDNNPNTYYSIGASPTSVSAYVMFNYSRAWTKWNGFRFQAMPSTADSWWLSDFPKDIKVWGSNKQSPVLTTDSDWEYQFQVTVTPPSSAGQWSPWVTFPSGLLFQNYRIQFVNNTYSSNNWVVVAGMELSTEGLKTAYSSVREVKANVAVYTRPFDWPVANFYEITCPRQITYQQPFIVTTTTGVSANYRARIYDLAGPSISWLFPERNKRFVAPDLSWEEIPKVMVGLKDYGGALQRGSTQVSMRRKDGGYHKYTSIDNFNSYEINFRDTPSGYGWQSVNAGNTDRMWINKGLATNVTVGENTIHSTGLEDGLNYMRLGSYHYNPVCYIEGSNTCEMITTNGVWNSQYQTSPYAYFTVPSGHTSWVYETKVVLDTDVDPRGQSAGILIADDSNPSIFYQLLVTYSGVIAYSHMTDMGPGSLELSTVQARTGSMYDPIWLRATRSGTALYFSYSEDYASWKTVYAGGLKFPLHPPLTSNNTPAPYAASASTQYAKRDCTTASQAFWPWRLSNTASGYCDYWTLNNWSGNNPPQQWIKIDLGSSQVVVACQVQLPDYNRHFKGQFGAGIDFNLSNEIFAPSDMKLQGSSDNVSWSTLGQFGPVPPYAVEFYNPLIVSTPSGCRYYRLSWTKAVGSPSNYADATAWTNMADIGSVYLFGKDDHTTLSGSSPLRVGLITSSDRGQLSNNYTLITPAMASNTSPSGYVCSASHTVTDAYKPFTQTTSTDRNDSNYWIVGPSVDPPYWLQLQLPTPKRVTGIRLQCRQHASWDWDNWGYGYGGSWLLDFDLQGSDDGQQWNNIQSFRNISLPAMNDWIGWWPWAYGGGGIQKILNYRSYLFYRIYMPLKPGNPYATGGSQGFDQYKIRQIELYGDGDPIINTVGRSKGYFEYSKFTDNSGNNTAPRDNWETLLWDITPMNSSTDSGLSEFQKIDNSEYIMYYTPSGVFFGGEPVYLRSIAGDQPSFKVKYPTENRLFLVEDSVFYPYVASGVLSSTLYPAVFYNPSSSLVGVEETTVFQGQRSMRFTGKSNTYVELSLPSSVDEWTYHCFVNPISNTTSGTIMRISPTSFRLVGNSIRVYTDNSYITAISGMNYSTGFSHLALTYLDGFLTVIQDGYKKGAVYCPGMEIPSGTSQVYMGNNYSGIIELPTLESIARKHDYFMTSNIYDEITMFVPASYHDFSVPFMVDPDINSPVVVPVSPVPNASGVCPASGIVFEVLDDYTGVNWNEMLITIDNITVWSGGNNMTEWCSDRGTLVYQDIGKKDGEWDWTTGEQLDGINRILYPAGTVYSGSGAWGRRFTYHVPELTELEYFDRRMQITVTGTDNRGYASQLDSIQPNAFSYEYGFDFITNDNIKMGNFFLDVGESERVDVLQAMDKHIWVDMWDSNYPTTDIVEDECTLRFSDGVVDFTCSGTWFTQYTNASGILVHRMHYDAGDYYWDGHRTMHWYVHAQNNDPTCHVYDEQEYQLLYGWHLFWLHEDWIPPFDFDKKLPVFVSIKTQDYVPTRKSKSWMLWTAPAGTGDFGVEIKAVPLGAGNRLEIDLLAHSHYLQYSEEVEVELSCKDRDGNELIYIWSFTTEDEPEN